MKVGYKYKQALKSIRAIAQMEIDTDYFECKEIWQIVRHTVDEVLK